MLRPGEDDLAAEPECPQAVETVTICEIGVQTHVVKLADRARRKQVATSLFPRVLLLLYYEHVEAGFGQPVRGCGARRAATHDEDIAREGGWARRLANGTGVGVSHVWNLVTWAEGSIGDL
jgi:hypothetical protein